MILHRSALAATLLYAVAAVALTWPLLPHAAQDVPGDLIDPLFTCWALGWNLHYLGLSPGGPQPVSYWDANIFYPHHLSLARSEHFLPQALQGAVVYALTGNLVLTYNVLFLATFVLSGTFLYLLAREETGDPWAALVAGFLYAFALFRWAQIPHLGALSSQWMPLTLLLARRVARAGRPWIAAGWIAALSAATLTQVLSSGYYLLFFTPFLAVWAAVEAWRARGAGPWLRLGAAAALAASLALPLLWPYAVLRAGGARRDLGSVVDHSADLLSFVTAPELTRLWGPVLDTFPRGEARCFPGLVTPLLALIALVASVHGGWREAGAAGSTVVPRAGSRRVARVAAVALGAVGAAALLAALAGGWSATIGIVPLRAVGFTRPLWLLLAASIAALCGWPRLGPLLGAIAARREVVTVALALFAAWLSLGPLATLRGWPIRLLAPYRWLFEHVPGFSGVRAPARFAMIGACFGALAAAWGLKRLRAMPSGPRLAWLLWAGFVVETSAVPLPLSRQWDIEGIAALPTWHGGAPSPIVPAIRRLPDDAVLAVLPFGEMFHEPRAMFDSAHHWRRLVNGYSSWYPAEYRELAFAVRDPLRRAPDVVAALQAAGTTHVLVYEDAWTRDKGPRVTERLVSAGARPIMRADGITLIALPSP